MIEFPQIPAAWSDCPFKPGDRVWHARLNIELTVGDRVFTYWKWLFVDVIYPDGRLGDAAVDSLEAVQPSDSEWCAYEVRYPLPFYGIAWCDSGYTKASPRPGVDVVGGHMVRSGGAK